MTVDSAHRFVVRNKIHSNKEEWNCCDICAILLCFIYVHNIINDAQIIYGSTTFLTNIGSNLRKMHSILSVLVW